MHVIFFTVTSRFVILINDNYLNNVRGLNPSSCLIFFKISISFSLTSDEMKMRYKLIKWSYC